MKLIQVPGNYSVIKMAPNEEVPEWAWHGQFCSVTKTPHEVSIVCETPNNSSSTFLSVTDWTILMVKGPLDFSLTGILSSITGPLAESKISIFAISTFDTDYILVRSKDIERAATSLRTKGFEVELEKGI